MLFALIVAMQASSGRTLRVAVVGGGISGLSFARSLRKEQVLVFDTGKRGVGGRCSSRLPSETGWAGAVDHAAQYVDCSTETFRKYVVDAVDLGVLRPSGDRFVGNDKLGISALPRDLARTVDVRSDVWVPPNDGPKWSNGKWIIGYDFFDALVIAHNGKCAERISSGFRSKQVKSALRARFAPAPKDKFMTLNAIYSLLVELPGPCPPLADLSDDKVLAHVSDNGDKLGWTSPDGSVVLTLLSTAAFGAANKHPQEQLHGTETEEKVTAAMLEALEKRALREGSVLAKPTQTRLQLWGAAVPLNAWVSEANFMWDPECCVGVVGDWLRASDDDYATSSIESAYLSGHALAMHILTKCDEAAGLDGSIESPGEGSVGSIQFGSGADSSLSVSGGEPKAIEKPQQQDGTKSAKPQPQRKGNNKSQKKKSGGGNSKHRQRQKSIG